MSDAVEAWCRREARQLEGVPAALRASVARQVLGGEREDLRTWFSLREGRWVAARDVGAEAVVWIVDHLFSFGRVDEVEAGLARHEGLRRRVAAMGGLPGEASSRDVVDECVWRFARATRRGAPRFFVEDEAGCAFRPSYDEAVVARVRGAAIDVGDASFTALWPETPLRAGDEPVRRVVEPEPKSPRFAESLRVAHRALFAAPRATAAFFGERRRRRREDRAERHAEESFVETVAPRCATPVTVSTDLAWVREHVRDERFRIVGPEDVASADAAFFGSGGVGARLRDEQLRSWYDYEAALIRKDHLSATLERAGLSEVAPLTFDLEIDLDAALEAALAEPRAAWILKPVDLGRSIGVLVTSSPRCIFAHAACGYVAQRYVENPVLFEGRKVDLRLVVLLRSARPLELYAHDVVFLRAANKPHDLAALGDLEVALTAMHLLDKPSRHPRLADFERAFPGGPAAFRAVLARCHAILADLFRAAADQHPGFAASSRASRAIYGCDFLLERLPDDPLACRPRLLEVTFSPAYLAVSDHMPDAYPDFADDCFRCLFLAQATNLTRLS
mmetsp:Transcript_19763/g.62213  ORF Transcript_19763/g.62213 Transcript_19763/m.62213 type:complete len:563 (-) Transcript_19763:162-1850(-)